MVYGVVGINMIAGPRRLVIVQPVPVYVAADLLSQAGHDKLVTFCNRLGEVGKPSRSRTGQTAERVAARGKSRKSFD